MSRNSSFSDSKKDAISIFHEIFLTLLCKLNSIFTISFGGGGGDIFPCLFSQGYFPWGLFSVVCFSGGVINIQTRPAFERLSEP